MPNGKPVEEFIKELDPVKIEALLRGRWQELRLQMHCKDDTCVSCQLQAKFKQIKALKIDDRETLMLTMLGAIKPSEFFFTGMFLALYLVEEMEVEKQTSAIT